jgi:hypothetical protein
MSLGTSTAHSFSLKTGNTRALTINSSQNATFAGDVSLGDAKFIKWGNGNQQILGNNTSGLSLYSNGERMRILTNGNVGIGTTSPSEKLEVDGIIKVVHTDDSYAKYRGQGVFFNRSNSYLSPEQDNFASLLIGYNGARWGNVEINGAFIKFENGPNEFMRITSAGNVGIGTTAPGATLPTDSETATKVLQLAGVSGSAGDTAVLLRSSDNSSGLDLWHNASTGDSYIDNRYNSNQGDTIFRVKTAGTPLEALRITGNGNVGIGTTSPNYKLASYSSGDEFAIVAGAGNAVGEFTGIGLSGYIATNAAVKAGLVFERETSWGIGKMHFLNNNTLGDSDATLSDSKMTIDSDGSVGIGTTSPDARLEVLTTTTNKFVRFRADNNEQRFEFYVGASGNASRMSMHNDAATETIRFASAGNSYFNGGNVGIGTTSPTSKIHVIGQDATFYSNTSSQSMQVGRNASERLETFVNDSNIKLTAYQDSDSDGGHGFIIDRSFAGSGANYFDIRKDGSSQMRINKDGNVGIGTTDPGRPLSINSDTAHRAIRILENDSANESWDIGVDVDGDLNFFNSADTSPTVSFLDTGNATFAGNVTIGDNSASEIFLAFNSSATDFALGANGSNFMIGTSSDLDSGNLITLSGANGRLGIGTTSPQSKLQVAGGIQMANDTATASAAKVGTMRYRTGTEYVEVTGTEILPNPGFDTDTNWVKGTGWTIANGKASVDNASSTALSQPSFGVTTGKIYNVRIDVSNYTSGSLQVQFGASQVIASIGANGEYNYTVTSTITGGTFYLYGVGDCEFSVDNASVIEVTAEDASYADMCMQTGSSTYEWVNIVRNTY